MQKQFLHTLMHRQVSVKFNTTQQGSGMVQTMLNRLEKFASWMVTPPDKYTMRWRFLVALRDPLRQEVLTRGYTTEFRTLEQLAEVATSIEDAMCYDMGTQIIDTVCTLKCTQGCRGVVLRRCLEVRGCLCFRSRVAVVCLLTEGRDAVRESVYANANETLASW